MGADIQAARVEFSSGKTISPEGVAHGSVTDEDWFALVRSIASVEDLLRSYIGSMGTVGSLVEVGTLRAKTSAGITSVCEIMGAPCRFYSIDKDMAAWAAWEVMFNNRHNSWVSTRFLNGTTAKVINQVLSPICWAFVDGCHCEDCVSIDIDAIVPKIPVGGVIAFHDAANQADLGMKVHRRYHGDGVERLYGVSTAIENSALLQRDFEMVDKVPAMKRPRGAPTPIFGGLQVWKRRRDGKTDEQAPEHVEVSEQP